MSATFVKLNTVRPQIKSVKPRKWWKQDSWNLVYEPDGSIIISTQHIIRLFVNTDNIYILDMSDGKSIYLKKDEYFTKLKFIIENERLPILL